MKKREAILFRILKITIVLMCFIGIVFVGFFPFKNSNILISFTTENGKYQTSFSSDELAEILDVPEGQLAGLDIVWEDMGATAFTEINISRKFKSITIERITASNLWEYGFISEAGMHFNQEGCEKLFKYANSLILERFIYAEIVIIIGIFLFILINVLKEKFDIENQDNHGPIFEICQFVKNISNYRKYMVYAAKADLNAEVANSYLNRLWWILEPFCNMLVYVIVFSGIMGKSVENYATFVFSGLVLWNYFSHTINYSVKCIRNNRDIVTKIYVPKYVLLITNMILNFIKLLFSLAVLLVMLMVFRVQIGWNVFLVIPVYIIVMLLSFGIGMIFLHYGVFIDDLGYAVGILLSMLMFLSGTFYEVITTLTEPLNFLLLSYNPIAMLIDTMRCALFYDEIKNIPLMLIWFVLSILLGYIGIHIVNKNENSYVKVI